MNYRLTWSSWRRDLKARAINPLFEHLGVALDKTGNVKTDANQMTTVDGIFAASDMASGQSRVA